MLISFAGVSDMKNSVCVMCVMVNFSLIFVGY